MKDTNKRFKEIIDSVTGGDFLIFCISISIFAIGMLGLETNFNQILSLFSILIGEVSIILGTCSICKDLQFQYLRNHASASNYTVMIFTIILGILLLNLAGISIANIVGTITDKFNHAFEKIGLTISILALLGFIVIILMKYAAKGKVFKTMTGPFILNFVAIYIVILVTAFTITLGAILEIKNISIIYFVCSLLVGILFCIIFLNNFLEVEFSKVSLFRNLALMFLGVSMIFVSNLYFHPEVNLTSELRSIFKTLGLVGMTIGIVAVFVRLCTTKKHYDSSIVQLIITFLKLFFYPVTAIALCTFFTWVTLSNSRDLWQLNHNITNHLGRDCKEDSIVSIVTKSTTPSTADKNRNIVDWLTVFNSSIQNLLGLIMFILGAATLYYVSKQLKDSKRSREGDAFMQTFTTLLAQQHAILTKDTLTDKAFLDDNYHSPDAFSGFVTYFDQHQKGTELSEIWKEYKDTLRDPASFDCCFKYFYHMIEIILANESVLYNPKKKKFYLKLIQAELNHDILFCYLVNLLVHFQENPYDIDDLRRFKEFSTESLSYQKLRDLDKNHKLRNLDKKMFKYLELNKDNLNQYFTENIINQYMKRTDTYSSQTVHVIIKDILSQNENKKVKDIFSQRIINKFKKEYFHDIFPDENPKSDNTNKHELQEEEFTILAQYHFFNDLKLNTEFIERVWEIANIGFDRIKTNNTRNNTPCLNLFLEVSCTGTSFNISFDKDENRLVLYREDNTKIVYNYFRGCSLCESNPHSILWKSNLDIDYNKVNRIDYIRISTKDKTIKMNGEVIDDNLVQALNQKYADTIFSLVNNILEIKNTVQDIYIQNSTKNRYVRHLRLLTGFYIEKEKVNENKKWVLYGIDRYEEAVQNIL